MESESDDCDGDLVPADAKIRRISTSYTNKIDAKDEKLVEHVFSIALILKAILKNLPTSDLLKISLINKHWCYCCRELLRERGCPVTINSTEIEGCSKLEELQEDILMSSSNFPFNNLSVAVASHFSVNCCTFDLETNRNRVLNPSIFEKLHLKTLSLKLPDININCVFYSEFIRLILTETAPTLESLSITVKGKGGIRLSNLNIDNMEGQWLPKLRRLEFPHRDPNFGCPETLMVELMRAASPNLRELSGKFLISIVPTVMELKFSDVIREFYFFASMASLDVIMEFARSSPKFQRLLISTAALSDKNPRLNPRITKWNSDQIIKLNEILSLLLTSSANCLEKLVVHQFDLIRLTTLGILPILKSVNCVKILFNPGIDHKEGYFTLRKINWEHYFPNLKTLSIMLFPWFPGEQEFFIDESFRNIQEDLFTCGSVTEFIWNENSIETYRDLQNVFKDLFPNVQELIMETNDGLDGRKFFNSWENLECIRFVKLDPKSSQWFDYIFNGVSLGECIHLLRNDAKYLEHLEIVPQQSSLLHLKCLKRLILTFQPHNCNLGYRGNRVLMENPLRLSSHLIFQRNPGLVVEIYRDKCQADNYCRFAMEYLKPFVKIFKRDDYDTAAHD